VLLAGLLLGATPARGDDQSASAEQERLEALEAELRRLQEELRRLEAAAREAQDAVESAARSEEQRINLSVYGTLDAFAYRGETSLLDGRLFELVLSGHPHRRLSFIAQVEFERSGHGKPAGEVIVEQAYPTLSFSPLLSFRAGVFQVPFANVYVDHFPANREVVSRPLVSEVIAPRDWSDNGVGIAGKRLFGKTWLASYEAWACAGLGAELGPTGMREARQGYGVDNNSNKAVVGRLSLNRASRWEAGISGYAGKYDDLNRLWLTGWAVDALALAGPLKLTGEYSSFTGEAAGPDARYRGFYLRGVYRLGQRALARTALGRDFEQPALALLAQYDQARVAAPGAAASRRERRLTLGMNYRPARQWLLKLAHEWNDAHPLPISKGDKDGWTGAVAFVF
jgi:hypothetical protein